MTELAIVRDRAAVETVAPGDEVFVLGEARVVSTVEGPYDDGTYVVVYFKFGEGCYENRAGRKRVFHIEPRLVELSLVPLRAGALLEIRRGEPAAAGRLRRDMERQQQRRADAG